MIGGGRGVEEVGDACGEVVVGFPVEGFAEAG
jgi:hypothetical protein